METKNFKVEIYKKETKKLVKTYIYDRYWHISDLIDIINDDYYMIIECRTINQNPEKEEIAKDLGIKIEEEEQK